MTLTKRPTDTERLIALATLLTKLCTLEQDGFTFPGVLAMSCGQLLDRSQPVPAPITGRPAISVSIYMPRPASYAIYYSTNDPVTDGEAKAGSRDWSLPVYHNSPAEALRAALDDVIDRLKPTPLQA